MEYQFCPRCAHPLTRRAASGGEQPQLVCTVCGFVFYQNSKPCAGALVEQDGKVLLARRAVEPARDAWDLPGGFLELGEHPRDGVMRELREETGLEVEPTELLGIYMDEYGESGDRTLNIYYLAEVRSGTLEPASDVSTLAWFGPDELPEELAFPHERQVLEDWKKRSYRAASGQALADLKTGFRLGGGPLPKREELHER